MSGQIVFLADRAVMRKKRKGRAADREVSWKRFAKTIRRVQRQQEGRPGDGAGITPPCFLPFQVI